MTADGAFTVRPYQRPRGVHPPLAFTGYRSSALRAPRRHRSCCRTG